MAAKNKTSIVALTGPKGTRVTVSDDLAEKLQRQGYKARAAAKTTGRAAAKPVADKK